MIQEGNQGRRRDVVDRVLADQFFDVFMVLFFLFIFIHTFREFYR
jgi:hypothetical protein